MSGSTNIWYVRDGRIEPDLFAVTAYRGASHPDGAVVEDAAPEGQLHWRTFAVERGILGVQLAIADEVPPLWFISVPEPKSSPAATNLVAFSDDTFAPGTVLSRFTFATAGVPNDQQLGAIRWFTATGVVDQVYVTPAWRRHQIGSALIYTASAVHQANGWPGSLRSDGRRTDLGQRWLAGLSHPERIAPLDKTMPPMDPA